VYAGPKLEIRVQGGAEDVQLEVLAVVLVAGPSPIVSSRDRRDPVKTHTVFVSRRPLGQIGKNPETEPKPFAGNGLFLPIRSPAEFGQMTKTVSTSAAAGTVGEFV